MKKEWKSLGMSDDRFNELMQEIAITERIDNSNTDMIDAIETKKEIQKAIGKFDVDIVYENETLCTALSGKTIVCFHIRKALN